MWVAVLSQIALVAALAPRCPGQQKIAYVLEMRGTWNLRGDSQQLYPGQGLMAGGFLVNSAPVDNDHIVVANLQGTIIKRIRCKSGVCKECRESGGCYDPIQPLPGNESRTGALAVAVDAILEIFAEKPDRFSIHRVRGADPALKRDGIAKVKDSTFDASYFFDGQPKGSYQVRLVAISVGSEQKQWQSGPIRLDWSPGEPALVIKEGLLPGVYEMRVEQNGEESSAWVLLCDSETCGTIQSSFEEFVRRTDGWGPSVTAETKRSYRRACLEYLYLRNPRLAQ